MQVYFEVAAHQPDRAIWGRGQGGILTVRAARLKVATHYRSSPMKTALMLIGLLMLAACDVPFVPLI